MRITLSGPPGSGTSTVGKLISEEFGLEYMPVSKLFRKMAEEKNVSLAEFSKMAEKDDRIDREFDERQKEMCRKDNIVVDSRLSPYLIDSDFKIFLHAKLEDRAERVAKRDKTSVDAARKLITDREESEAKRYKAYYGYDINDLSIYDLVINTSNWTAESVEKIIKTSIQEVKKWKSEQSA